MTGEDIKAAVYNLTKDRAWAATSDSVDDLIINWMSLAIQEFPPEAVECNIDTIPTVVAGEHYELPVDFAAAAHYEIYSGGEMVRKDIDDTIIFTPDSQIIFPFDNDLVQLYYYPIVDLESVADEIPLQRIFHSCLMLYFYAQYYYQSGEGDYEEHKLADSFMGRFYKLRDDKLNIFMNKTSMGDPVKTTDALPSRSRGLRTYEEDPYYEFE